MTYRKVKCTVSFKHIQNSQSIIIGKTTTNITILPSTSSTFCFTRSWSICVV